MASHLPIYPTRDSPPTGVEMGILCELKPRPSAYFAGTNLLLRSLPTEDREYLLSRSEEVVLPIQKVLHYPNESRRYGYFISSGLALIIATMQDGQAAEVGMVGNEGLIGGFELLGPARVSTECIMQGSGKALRIPFAELRKAFEERKNVRSRILEFLQQQALGQAQIAGCNRLHDAQERLARWLLMAQDHSESDVLLLTQEFLAEMLGSRRTTITVVAGGLQRDGLIEYSRGRIKILNRERLEMVACSCYPIVKSLHENLYSMS